MNIDINNKFIFNYIDIIFDFEFENDTKLLKEKIKNVMNEFKFSLENCNFITQNVIYNNIRKNYFECDIIINSNQNFILKTPLVKCIKNNYPYLTFELLNIHDNIQVDIFEYIINKLQNKLKLKNKTFEPFIHYNKYKTNFVKKKYFTIKYEENYSKCVSKMNTFISESYNIKNESYNINFVCILSIQLNKRYVDKVNNYMGLEWIISQIKFVELQGDLFNSIVDFSNSYLVNENHNIPPPPPPPPPPIIDLNKKHEIVIHKKKVLDKILKNIPSNKMTPPSLSDIQTILDKMKKNKNSN
jgi:hypothetical protein